MKTSSPFYVLSAELSHKDSEYNSRRSSELRQWLVERGYDFMRVVGCWYGNTEEAFAVWGLSEGEAQRVGYCFDQEAVLNVDAGRQAALLYCRSGAWEQLGAWREVSSKALDESGCFTYVPQTNTYWRAVRRAEEE